VQLNLKKQFTLIGTLGLCLFGRLHLLRILANGTLILWNLAASDEGGYLCKASNGVGEPVSKIAEILVDGEKKTTLKWFEMTADAFFSVPATFAFTSENLTAVIGSRAEVVCSPDGDAPIDVRWERNGQHVPGDGEGGGGGGLGDFERFTVSDQGEGDGGGGRAGRR